MAASERYVGKDLRIQWIHSGGTATISGDWTSFDVTRDSEEVDLTAADDTGTYMKYTRQVNGASMTSHFIGTAGSAVIGSATVRGTSGTLLYGPGGTATNDPKGGFPAYIKSANVSQSYDGNVELSIEFSPQGAELFNPMIDVWA